MTKDEWIAKCKARYIERAGVSESLAQQAAEATYEAAIDAANLFKEPDLQDPEEAADDDMDCWDDDGDDDE